MKVHLAVWADEEQDLHLRVVVCDRCFGLLYPHRRDVDAQVSLEDDDSIRVRTAAGTSPSQIALADQARTKTLKLPQRIVWRQRSSTNGRTASSRRRIMRRVCEGLVDGDDVLGEVLALGEDEGNALGRVVSAWPATASAIGSSWSLADGGHRRFPSRPSFLRDHVV